jgi:lysine biosynthesis protein LysW
MAKARCPYCKLEVQLGENPQLGQVETCWNCGKEFEVIWLYPMELYLHEDDHKEDPRVTQD